MYAHANPLRFVDPTGHAAGDLWDPRTYFSDGARAGAWQGFREGYSNSAADIGDSLSGFGRGAYNAGEGLATGAAGLAVTSARLQANTALGVAEVVATGDANRLHEVVSEVASMGQDVGQEIATTARIAKEAYSNPSLALDAATELGIEGTAEVVGGATFETALLVAPAAKGGAAATVVSEGRSTAVRAAVTKNPVTQLSGKGGFARYAESPTVVAAERGASARAGQAAAIRASVTESAGVREAAAGGFARYAEGEASRRASGASVSRGASTPSVAPGEFSIIDWSGYPSGIPRPTGTFRLLEGAQYDTARRAASAANQSIRRSTGLRGRPVEVHEIKPVKFGGDPVDLANKLVVPRDTHRRALTPWWNKMLKDLSGPR